MEDSGLAAVTEVRLPGIPPKVGEVRRADIAQKVMVNLLLTRRSLPAILIPLRLLPGKAANWMKKQPCVLPPILVRRKEELLTVTSSEALKRRTGPLYTTSNRAASRRKN